jgi:hypothetical protein
MLVGPSLYPASPLYYHLCWFRCLLVHHVILLVHHIIIHVGIEFLLVHHGILLVHHVIIYVGLKCLPAYHVIIHMGIKCTCWFNITIYMELKWLLIPSRYLTTPLCYHVCEVRMPAGPARTYILTCLRLVATSMRRLTTLLSSTWPRSTPPSIPP